MIYPETESKSLELKEKIPKKNQLLKLLKTCVAFANGNGGEIIFGIEDSSRKIIGMPPEAIELIYEEIINSIVDGISPSIIPDIFTKNFGEKTLVHIKIYPGSKIPYFVKKEGCKKGVYLRIGSSARRASEEYIEDLNRQRNRINFDETPTSTFLANLDQKQLTSVYGKSFSINSLLMDKVIVRDTRDQSKLIATKAGVLFFHKTPETIIPEAILLCSQFKGTQGRDIIRTTEFTGPIPQIIEASLKLLESWLERNLKMTPSGQLLGEPLVPLEAIREGLTNALIHRKYFIPGAVKIAVYEDKLEIFSPGNLPGLVTAKSLGNGISYLRNPALAKLARKHKLMEKLGSGVNLIYTLCKQKNLKKPRHIEDDEFVKLIFFFEKRKLNKKRQTKSKLKKLTKTKTQKH